MTAFLMQGKIKRLAVMGDQRRQMDIHGDDQRPVYVFDVRF